MLAYNASHILGLTTGKVLKDPLDKGAHLLIGITHKNLPRS